LGRAAKADEMLDSIGTTTLGMTTFDVKKIKVDGEVRPHHCNMQTNIYFLAISFKQFLILVGVHLAVQRRISRFRPKVSDGTLFWRVATSTKV